eukprot:TRINITY_DN11278_c0_g1_i1.p1 TRINITY_DN11278_c0_g1~~TRINITY_DN11278_c0_g1_i1.p1  ORF type:complete len:258 (-),score=43.59 TRINITY_DN11278_c0_g1_i1:213-986(-)
MSVQRAITKEELTTHFELPIKVAAAKLGVCTTVLKKLCRQHGIPRWPHRKITSINRSIQQLEALLSRNPQDEMLQMEIESKRGQIDLLRNQPQLVVNTQKKRKADQTDKKQNTNNKRKKRDNDDDVVFLEQPLSTNKIFFDDLNSYRMSSSSSRVVRILGSSGCNSNNFETDYTNFVHPINQLSEIELNNYSDPDISPTAPVNHHNDDVTSEDYELPPILSVPSFSVGNLVNHPNTPTEVQKLPSIMYLTSGNFQSH